MLPDLSPAHILIVVVAALIFIGPKDLPLFLRKVGQFMGKMRGMANEFRASFDEMARQSELDELRKEVEAMRAAATVTTPDLGLNAHLGLDSHAGLGGVMTSDAEGAYMDQHYNGSSASDVSAAAPPDPAPAPTPDAAKASAPEEAAPDAEAAKPRARKTKPATETGV
jgi:sec-independent protein translocase protein TatB